MKLRIARKIGFSAIYRLCYNKQQMQRAFNRLNKSMRRSNCWFEKTPEGLEFIGAEVVSKESDNATNL